MQGLIPRLGVLLLCLTFGCAQDSAQTPHSAADDQLWSRAIEAYVEPLPMVDERIQSVLERGWREQRPALTSFLDKNQTTLSLFLAAVEPQHPSDAQVAGSREHPGTSPSDSRKLCDLVLLDAQRRAFAGQQRQALERWFACLRFAGLHHGQDGLSLTASTLGQVRGLMHELQLHPDEWRWVLSSLERIRSSGSFQLSAHTEIELTRVALALRFYASEHGSQPRTLDALVSDYFAQLPEDPYEPGLPLKLHTTKDHWWLYSIGPDGIDQGGLIEWKREQPKAPGDIVFAQQQQ